MIVRVLMETDDDRHYQEVNGVPTDIDDLALTPCKNGVSVTHIPTGRAVNDGPITTAAALQLIDDMKKMDIPWGKIVDGDNSKLLRFIRQ